MIHQANIPFILLRAQYHSLVVRWKPIAKHFLCEGEGILGEATSAEVLWKCWLGCAHQDSEILTLYETCVSIQLHFATPF